MFYSSFVHQFKDALRIYSLQLALIACFAWLPFVNHKSSYFLGVICITLPAGLVFLLHALLHRYTNKLHHRNNQAKMYTLLFLGIHIAKYVLILSLLGAVFLLLPELHKLKLIDFKLNSNNGAYGVIASGVSYVLATMWVGARSHT